MSSTTFTRKQMSEAMRLYAVTDRSFTGSSTLYAQVESALLGGVTCVQLREKDLDEQALLKEAVAIRNLCHRFHVPFLIDDNVSFAQKCDADGVHVGQNDMPAAQVRTLLGPKKIIGVTAKTVEQAVSAERDGADYLGSGAVFHTSTKTDTSALPHDRLRDICHAVSIPVCAIGGIGLSNILELAGTDIDGVAIVSAIFSSPDITDTCSRLLTLSNQISNDLKRKD